MARKVLDPEHRKLLEALAQAQKVWEAQEREKDRTREQWEKMFGFGEFQGGESKEQMLWKLPQILAPAPNPVEEIPKKERVELPIKINVSEALTFQKCPRLWAARYVYGKRTVGRKERALVVGVATHEVWAEAMLKPSEAEGWDAKEWGYRIERAVVHRLAGMGIEADDEDKDQAESAGMGACHAFAALAEAFPGLTLAVEQSFGVPVHGVEVFGRWDQIRRVGLEAGRKKALRHVQLKTCSRMADVPALVEHTKYTWHEHVYAHAGEAEFGEEFEGTILVVIVKAPVHIRMAGQKCTHCGKSGLVLRDPGETYRIFDIALDRNLTRSRLLELASVAEDLTQVRKALEPLPVDDGFNALERREGACRGFGGGPGCMFQEACWRGTSLTDGLIYTDDDPLAGYKNGNGGGA